MDSAHQSCQGCNSPCSGADLHFFLPYYDCAWMQYSEQPASSEATKAFVASSPYVGCQ